MDVIFKPTNASKWNHWLVFFKKVSARKTPNRHFANKANANLYLQGGGRQLLSQHEADTKSVTKSSLQWGKKELLRS